ncbi:MAG: hypothetical protein AAGK23_10300 [Pseudomonadota bacterium]
MTDAAKCEAGITLTVLTDPDPLNPITEFDQTGRMACWHRRYRLGHEQPDVDPQEWRDALPEDTLVLPLYLLDHSGITMSTKPFSCPWDSGQVGWIWANAGDIERAFMVNEITEQVLERARQLLIAEVAEYDRYLRGDVWMFQVRYRDGSVLDACGGFPSFNDALEEGNGVFAACVAQARARDAARLASDIAESRPDLAPAT